MPTNRPFSRLSGPGDTPRAEQSGHPEQPGALQGEIWLTLQTRQAQQLIRGRSATPDKPTIIGLIGFADRLRLIWQAARGDDPYADWWLIQVHEAIARTASAIHRRHVELDQQRAQMTALAVSLAVSERPYRVQLQFANPYAYRGAQLLADYDRLVCTALTARHIGLLDGQACGNLQSACARKLRAVFMLPQRYRFLKIDRAAVRTHTGSSHAARQAMGEVPADILSGERQAPLVPRKMKFPTGIAGGVGLRSEPAGCRTKHADAEDPENHDS